MATNERINHPISTAELERRWSAVRAAMAEYRIDFQIPLAAAFDADWVSSDRWAEASKPVIVYWVSRNPNGTTAKKKIMLPVLPLE